MALTDITEKILAEANETKDSIAEETRQEVARIEQETKDRKRELKRESDQALEREKQHRREQARARANQDKKRAIEGAKRRHIEEVFEEALRRLTALETSEYTSLVASLAQSLPSLESGLVLVPSARSDETAKALAQAGVTLASSPTDAIQGGFVVQTDKAEYDYSFRSLIHEARQTAELDVAEALLSGNTSS